MKETFTEDMRLRFEPLYKPFNIVLIEPEIPLNTGSVARLCAATSSNLIIIGKPKFSLSSSKLKRAGVDYWQFVNFRQYESLDDYINQHRDSALFFFSAKAKTPYTQCNFQKGDTLVFGKESTGIPFEVLNRFKDRLYCVPTVANIRSLNLANVISIVLYDALRRVGAFENLFFEEC